MLRSIHALLLALVLVSLPLLIPPLHAQSGGEPALHITKIETQNFPEVKVYLRSENLGADLSGLPVTLLENGQQVDIHASEIKEVGTQTAILLDASGSFLDPGLTGELRYVEVRGVVRRLTELGILSKQSDLLAAYAPEQSGSMMRIQDWTLNHETLANNLDNYNPPSNIDLETPLYDLIYFALDHFNGGDGPDNAAKKIVLFSDGVAGTSDLKLDDAVNRAKEQNIPIYTVLLGEGTDESRRNMTRIAKLTRAEAYQITSLNALDGLWNSLIEGREQRVLTYRSQLAQPTEILASVTLPDGVPVRAAIAFSALGVSPVEIVIVQPTNDLRITKEAPEHDTPLENLEPNTIDIQVDFLWPDGQPRNLTRVEYIVNNHAEVRLDEPFNQISFPIDRLDSGNYTIRVIAIDELELKGESSPLTFRVNVRRPICAYNFGPLSIPCEEISAYLGFLGLSLGTLAVVIALRKPTVRQRVTGIITEAFKVVTEPFNPSWGNTSKSTQVKAKLVVVERGRASSLPDTLDLCDETTKIGRSSEYANLVIPDQRVSRLHCRITQEPDGSFRLYDEGAASGTDVNYKAVDIDGQVLQSGDLMILGPVQLRFYYKSDYDNPTTEPFTGQENEDKTEPSQPVAPNN